MPSHLATSSIENEELNKHRSDSAENWLSVKREGNDLVPFKLHNFVKPIRKVKEAQIRETVTKNDLFLQLRSSKTLAKNKSTVIDEFVIPLKLKIRLILQI